ncbi:MAG TPA: glycerophosphodiester phosphodiesterase family protein [Turneriella sp.]|nr:glycerophosphodiester phosphodiesterase family protein [Turneriella sp.]
MLLSTCSQFAPPTGDVSSQAYTPPHSEIDSLSKRPKIELHGHRGARGLAPENTWPAFEKAIRLGIDAVELDVQLTRDDAFVIHHDAFTNSKLCQKDNGARIHARAIQSLTVTELKTLDCGSKKNKLFPEQENIPHTRLITLDEFFIHVRQAESDFPQAKDVRFNIEIKILPNITFTDTYLHNVAKRILQIAAAHSMTKRIMVPSFELRLLPFVKAIDATVPTAALFISSKRSHRKRTPRDFVERAQKYQADIIAPYYKDITPQLIIYTHRKNLRIFAWTVNEPSDIKKIIAMGVDGIISDYPDRLIRAHKSLHTSIRDSFPDIRKIPTVSP